MNTVPISSQVVDQAEKYAFISLEIPLKSGSGTEAVPVYGIEEDSRYWDMDVSGDEVVAGAGLLEKYDLNPGDTVVLHDKYAGEDRTFTLARSWGSESNMGVYMKRSTFNEVFDEPEGYFNGYASNEPLSLDRRFVLNDLTPEAMDKISNQLKDSMGSVVKMIRLTSIVLFVVLMYLLTKTVLDRSSRAISHMKVFGYRNREVDRLYLRSITGAVVAFVIACIPLNFILLKIYVRNAFADSAGNMPLVFDVSFIMETVVLSLVCYAVIALLHVRRVRRVPLSLALKTQE